MKKSSGTLKPYQSAETRGSLADMQDIQNRLTAIQYKISDIKKENSEKQKLLANSNKNLLDEASNFKAKLEKPETSNCCCVIS